MVFFSFYPKKLSPKKQIIINFKSPKDPPFPQEQQKFIVLTDGVYAVMGDHGGYLECAFLFVIWEIGDREVTWHYGWNYSWPCDYEARWPDSLFVVGVVVDPHCALDGWKKNNSGWNTCCKIFLIKHDTIQILFYGGLFSWWRDRMIENFQPMLILKSVSLNLLAGISKLTLSFAQFHWVFWILNSDGDSLGTGTSLLACVSISMPM